LNQPQDQLHRPQLSIIYQDDDLIAINKPTGIFVHKTALDPSATRFVLQEVRNMIGKHVHPVHRLDRKTSGILLLAKSKPIQSILNEAFRDRHISKKYLAVVRGWVASDEQIIDYPLLSDSNKVQEAKTKINVLQRVEIPLSDGRFPTSRYTLLEVDPLTGRRHQIRRHLAHIFHPIIGDRPHGCNKQNKLFLDGFAMNDMLLHARSLTFTHPSTLREIYLSAPVFGEFERMVDVFGLDAAHFEV